MHPSLDPSFREELYTWTRGRVKFSSSTEMNGLNVGIKSREGHSPGTGNVKTPEAYFIHVIDGSVH